MSPGAIRRRLLDRIAVSRRRFRGAGYPLRSSAGVVRPSGAQRFPAHGPPVSATGRRVGEKPAASSGFSPTFPRRAGRAEPGSQRDRASSIALSLDARLMRGSEVDRQLRGNAVATRRGAATHSRAPARPSGAVGARTFEYPCRVSAETLEPSNVSAETCQAGERIASTRAEGLGRAGIKGSGDAKPQPRGSEGDNQLRGELRPPRHRRATAPRRPATPPPPPATRLDAPGRPRREWIVADNRPPRRARDARPATYRVAGREERRRG